MIRAIVFDAVGTLIHPDPPAAAVYADVGRRFGSRLPPAEVRVRFAQAFAGQELLDREAGLRTSEERELQRWRTIVAQTLYDVRDREGCFQELYEHFAQPKAWRCDPDASRVLGYLHRFEYRPSLASNFDQRLHAIRAGLPELRDIDQLIVSSEVGWRKPAPEFFAAVARTLTLPPEEIMLVGDDRVNDYDGARQAGMQAVLLDPRDKHPDLRESVWRISHLDRVVDLLEFLGRVTYNGD